MTRLSVLDLAAAGNGVSANESLRASATVAQQAERLGYVRYWFSEHHNIPDIVSSTPSILAGYIAANTKTIRVGAGGVMLPNHSPLIIAEQYGTLETLYPGRIDLGLGRAPGTDGETWRALRRDPSAAERFPQDVIDLQALLGPLQPGQQVQAVPGTGTRVPLYILGSSLFGAQLAGLLGLPYAFASHFAPTELLRATALYRHEFRPSEQLDRPYVIAGMNVFGADSTEQATALFTKSLARMARNLQRRSGDDTHFDDDVILQSPIAAHARHMLSYTAFGTADTIRKQVQEFATIATADEVMVVMSTSDLDARLRSYEILAATFD